MDSPPPLFRTVEFQYICDGQSALVKHDSNCPAAMLGDTHKVGNRHDDDQRAVLIRPGSSVRSSAPGYHAVVSHQL